MRLLYDNKIKGAVLTPSTENANYPASNLKDPRLSRHLRFTSDSWQTLLVDSGGLLKDIFQATVNLLTNPESLWNWTTSGATAVPSGLYYDGKQFAKITLTASSGYIKQSIVFTNDGVKAISIILRKGTDPVNKILVRDASVGLAVKLEISVTWATKAVGEAIGTAHIIKWLDGDTVSLSCITIAVVAANDNQLWIRGQDDTKYFYATAAQGENLTYPTPYVNGSRSAVSPTHAFQMPGKFIFKLKVGPWFGYNITDNPRFVSWRIDDTHRFLIYYQENAPDKISVYWHDGTAGRLLNSQQFDDGTSYDDINSRLILFGAIRLDQQTGQRFFVIVDGVKQAESTDFSGAPDALTSTFSTILIGHEDSFMHADSQFESVQFWAWDGSDLGTLNNEADIDVAMAGKPTIFEQIYQPKIKASYVALAGHNLSADALIKVQGNDWNSWYGPPPFEQVFTWDADIILKNFTEKEYPYWRFVLNNPNNEDGYIKLGLAYLGTYLTMPYIEPGVEMPRRTASVKTRSGSGQIYGRKNYSYHSFTVVYPPFIDSDERDAIDQMFAQVLNVDPLFVLLWENSLDVFPPLYCTIVEPELPWKKSDEGRYWGLSVSFEEVF